ncbi:hypothetical protein AB3M80_15405 [Arthrospira platensis BEA 1257B]
MTLLKKYKESTSGDRLKAKVLKNYPIVSRPICGCSNRQND